MRWESHTLPRNLNLSNRRMRTRTSGGVAGVPGDFRGPYADGVPSMSTTWRCKSSGEAGRSDPEQTARRRSVARRLATRPALKEAGSEAASRRTETGYEASPGRASGPMTAKLSRPRLRRCRSGDCAGKVEALTWGGLALRLKGRRPSRDEAEREVSRGHSTVEEAGRRERRAGMPEVFGDGKGRTEGRANRP